MTEASNSLWRSRVKSYFGISENQKQNEYTKCMYIGGQGVGKGTRKLAVDTVLPLSFYVGDDGSCLLYSLTKQGKTSNFNCLGKASLRGRTSLYLNEVPNSIAHFNNWLLVATDFGVYQYEINCGEVARDQNLDDFVQMALPKQIQPVSEFGEPVATFYSCDIQMKSWSNPTHSVIDASKIKDDDLREVEAAVKRHYQNASKNKPFESSLLHIYDHNADSEKNVPVSGPVSTAVRQISFTYRNPNSFQSICGSRWFDWDINHHKQKYVGTGDGFQLLSIDSSPLLRETYAIGTHGGNIILHDMRKALDIQRERAAIPTPISHVKFSSMIQPLLATTTDDFKINLWDLRAGLQRPYQVLDGHTHEITGLQFSYHRGDFLFSSSYDGTVKIWNINNMYPPHHCVMTVHPSVNIENHGGKSVRVPTYSPVLDISAGCHRTDSFYFSCMDGTTGVCKLKKPLFDPVIPHRLETEEEQEFERLLYYKKNQQLLSEVLPKVNELLAKKTEDVSPIFPLMDLTVSKPFDLNHAKIPKDTPIKDVISMYSYFLSNAIPPQFVQSPEPQQLADAKRNLLFAQVMSGIQRKDAKILTEKKRDIVNALDAFSRDTILSIVQVIASSSFDEALEVGHSYLELLEANKKLDKFLDVGYFLLYPTIYDNPSVAFRPLGQIEHNVRTRLRSVLNQGKKLLGEILDYQAVLATAMNDQETACSKMFETLKKHESFLSMFLCRTYLSLGLSLAQWSTVIIFASQIAKDTDGFVFQDTIYDWLENVVCEPFYTNMKSILSADRIDPASYINALSEIIIVASHAQTLPKRFEDALKELVDLVKGILESLLSKGESQRTIDVSPAHLALAIRKSIDSHGRAMPQQGNMATFGRNVNFIMTIINNSISTAQG